MRLWTNRKQRFERDKIMSKTLKRPRHRTTRIQRHKCSFDKETNLCKTCNRVDRRIKREKKRYLEIIGAPLTFDDESPFITQCAINSKNVVWGSMSLPNVIEPWIYKKRAAKLHFDSSHATAFAITRPYILYHTIKRVVNMIWRNVEWVKQRNF